MAIPDSLVLGPQEMMILRDQRIYGLPRDQQGLTPLAGYRIGRMKERHRTIEGERHRMEERRQRVEDRRLLQQMRRY